MIKNGTVVTMIYLLKNSKNEVLDQADQKDPFSYLHGAQQIVPGLETALAGLKAGDKKNVQVAPSQGYGEIDASLKMELNRSQFPANMQLQPGMQFETHTPEGHGIIFTVEAVKADKVLVDGNHPLAGQILNFEVEIISLREATKEELSHGHAHGAQGHSH